jgi:hypothetical protein
MSTLIAYRNLGWTGVVIRRTDDSPLSVAIGEQVTLDVDDPLVAKDLHNFRGRLTPIPDPSNALHIKTKYILAVVNRVHMNADQDLIVEYGPVPDDASLPNVCDRLNDLVESQTEHGSSVGTISVDGSHQVSDADGLSTLSGLTDLPLDTILDDVFVRIHALDDYRYAHASATVGSVHVHFTDDVELNNGELTVTAEADTADAILNVNELRMMFINHFMRASE